MTNTLETVLELLALKKEGQFWDFKLKHHENPIELVRDIICLANTTRHKGERYLIYGICPTSHEIRDLKLTTPRRTQADIIGILRNANFSSGSFPEITLETFTLGEAEIDVLAIADVSKKPYYLEKDYTSNGKTLRAGAIYSRTQDTNTPADRVAAQSDVERMWRERFGLDATALERLENYLLDFDGWEEINENNWHYKQFPEFTIAPTEQETWRVEAGDNWVRVAPNPMAYVRPFVAKYHQTILANITCIYYDEMRALMPAPDVSWVHNNLDMEWFHSYCADTQKFKFLQFFLKKSAPELLDRGLYGGRCIMRLPIIVFSSKVEKEAFIKHATSQTISIMAEDEFKARDQRISELDKEIIAYSRAVIRLFDEWKSACS